MLQFFDTLTDDSGNALLGATVLVQNYPALTLAAIYSTNGTANPIATSTVAADITGQVSFYIPDGDYQLTYSYQGHIYKTRVPVALLDPMGFVALADTGAANAYAITDSRLAAQLYTGMKVELLLANSNTGASTLNVNGSGAKAIVYPGGGAVAGGALAANGLFRFEYDGTAWEIMSQVPLGTAVGPALYPLTLAEQNAGIVAANIVNGNYAPGIPDRYKTNTTPGTTDMSTAVQFAVNQNPTLQAGGSPLNLAYGPYNTTVSIANLHAAVKTGFGLIQRGANTFAALPAYAQNENLYVNPSTGLDTNDGLGSGQPFLTGQGMVNALNYYGPVLGGQWNLNCAAGLYTTALASIMTFNPEIQSYNTIQVLGPSGALPFVPTALFGPNSGSATYNGIACNGNNNVQVNNLYFQNLNNSGNAFGIVGQLFSYLAAYNCYFNNVDLPIKAQQCRLVITGGVSNGGQTVITLIAGTVMTIGGVNVGDTSAGVSGVATTSTAGTGATATIGFAAQPSAPVVGSTVTIRGVLPAGYNGTFVVTASSLTSVSYANATTGAQTQAGTMGYNYGAASVGFYGTNAALAGVSGQDGINGHIDYCTFDNCAVGIDIIGFSQFHGTGTNLINNASAGMRATAASHFYNDITTPCTYAGNACNELYYSGSMNLTRSEFWTTWMRQPIAAAQVVTSGTSLTTLATFTGAIVSAQFNNTTKAVRVRAAGQITGANNTKAIAVAVDTVNAASFTVPAAYTGSWVLDLEIDSFTSAGTQLVHGFLILGAGDSLAFQAVTTLTLTAGTITVTGQCVNAGDSVKCQPALVESCGGA
jgi:hypothetical protein